MSPPRELDPPYQRVAAWLRGEISAGRLRPGEQVPSATVLAAQFGVSRNTAARALAMLRDEGLILTQRGWGSFVTGEPG
jgi:DNA-binding GntR family transcriptional regulator